MWLFQCHCSEGGCGCFSEGGCGCCSVTIVRGGYGYCSITAVRVGIAIVVSLQ